MENNPQSENMGGNSLPISHPNLTGLINLLTPPDETFIEPEDNEDALMTVSKLCGALDKLEIHYQEI